MNKLALTGRLATPPQIRFFDSGKCVCKFAIAVNRGPDKPTDFFDCEAWQQTAEALQHASKGDEISILGSLTQQKWSDKETGKERSRVIVNCWDATYFSKPGNVTPNVSETFHVTFHQPPQTKTHGGDYPSSPF